MSGALAEPAPFSAFGGENTNACVNCTPSFLILPSPIFLIYLFFGVKQNSAGTKTVLNVACKQAFAVKMAVQWDLQLKLVP